MIKGGFNNRRPHISGLLLFSGVNPTPVTCRFLVDTGADRTLLVPSDYESDGFRYQDFRTFPLADSRGVGGELEGRLVEAKLILRRDDGTLQQIAIEVEVAKPTAAIEQLPSLLGRDVTDLFRLMSDPFAWLFGSVSPGYGSPVRSKRNRLRRVVPRHMMVNLDNRPRSALQLSSVIT